MIMYKYHLDLKAVEDSKHDGKSHEPHKLVSIGKKNIGFCTCGYLGKRIQAFTELRSSRITL
tara:strand:- start:90 stop:275 length:186 start_codon:yes stop_codon:yes gene_type:complete